jgi:tetratricopeptide (TPR) repeat protein
VLLVSIDTLRADRLGSYGYDRAESPRLDAPSSALPAPWSAASEWRQTIHKSITTWALVAEARGNNARAVEEYRAEVENRPDHFESWFNLSLLLAEEGDFEGASDALRQTIVAKPGLAVAHLFLGRALLAHGDPQSFEEAAEAVERGLALNPQPDLRQIGRDILAEINKLR